MEESIIEVVEESIKDLNEVVANCDSLKYHELVAIAEKLDAQYEAAQDTLDATIANAYKHSYALKCLGKKRKKLQKQLAKAKKLWAREK